LSSAAQEQETQTVEKDLPAKLCEIVRLFQSVGEQRARYQQLLYYGQKLKPLAKEFCIPENKVNGCVSQVWVVCKLGEDGRVYFEAESDSALTKGLAALLVDGLSGATPAEVLKVSPDFVQKLGLQQSLTPSRSNGFLNMLKLMQKKTMQSYVESSVPKSDSAASSTATDPEPNQPDGLLPGNDTKPREEKVTTVRDSIERKLSERLNPVQIEVEDVSHQHAGHAGAPRGSSETHFNVKVVSDEFQGLSLVKRHRLIYGLLQEELQNGLHALSLVTKTPAEISDKP
jgi:sulfur transfer protein SufE/stress-induced morphogen